MDKKYVYIDQLPHVVFIAIIKKKPLKEVIKKVFREELKDRKKIPFKGNKRELVNLKRDAVDHFHKKISKQMIKMMNRMSKIYAELEDYSVKQLADIEDKRNSQILANEYKKLSEEFWQEYGNVFDLFFTVHDLPLHEKSEIKFEQLYLNTSVFDTPDHLRSLESFIRSAKKFYNQGGLHYPSRQDEEINRKIVSMRDSGEEFEDIARWYMINIVGFAENKIDDGDIFSYSYRMRTRDRNQRMRDRIRKVSRIQYE